MRQSAVIQRNWQSLIKPEKLEVEPGADPVARRHHRRRTAGARLRHDAGQRDPAHPAVVAAGRRGDRGADRRRAARVQQHPRRARGRHRHRAEHQAARAADARRGPEAHDADRDRAGRGARRADPGRPRHRDHEPRAGDLHAGRRREARHGVHGEPGQGLSALVGEPAGGRADRADPGRLDLLAGAPRVVSRWSRPASAR